MDDIEEKDIKIPSLREILDVLNSKTVRMLLLCIAVIILIISALRLADISSCKDKGGFYMEDKSCYIPKSETERKEILENGFVKTGFDWNENLSKILEGKEINYEP